jgi:hypothetical protein
VVSVFSSFRELDDMLARSSMLVGGVEEEDCAFDEASTVIALKTESEEDARVTSGRATARGAALILSRRVENMAMLDHVAFM